MSHAQERVSQEMEHNKPIIFNIDTPPLTSVKGHCCLNGAIKQCTKAQAEKKSLNLVKGYNSCILTIIAFILELPSLI